MSVGVLQSIGQSLDHISFQKQSGAGRTFGVGVGAADVGEGPDERQACHAAPHRAAVRRLLLVVQVFVTAEQGLPELGTTSSRGQRKTTEDAGSIRKLVSVDPGWL